MTNIAEYTDNQFVNLKIILAGTPYFSAHHLQALIDNKYDVVAVYSQPDRPCGRGKKIIPSPVKMLALKYQLPIEQPISLKDKKTQQTLAAYNPDIIIVVAYGLLLPQAILDIPRYGCLNVHGSILPRWRGAAPIQRAIEAGDNETGISIMQMNKNLDAGDILSTVYCPIDVVDTSASLHDKLMHLGARALLNVLEKLPNKNLKPRKQDHDAACYAEKITKQEAQINWTESAEEIIKKIYAFNPFPIAYTFLNDERIKIYFAEMIDKNIEKLPGEIISINENGLLVCCQSKAILIKKLQIPNKKVMSVTEILNGYAGRFDLGQRFYSQYLK